MYNTYLFTYKHIIFLILLVNITSCKNEKSESTSTKRTIENINADWLYLEENHQSIDEAAQSEGWEKINLPHTWNALDATDLEPGYRRNTSWYKKEIEFEKIEDNKLYHLYFEGANISSEVYVNGENVGDHIGGYLGFTIDITNAIRKGKNEILVKVSNEYNPEIIPSQKSDFFIFGGITRDVWLKTLPNQHISSLKISTPNVSKENAKLKAIVSVENQTNSNIKAILRDSKGFVVKSLTLEISGEKSIIYLKDIKNPNLWDTENPYLYDLAIQLIENNQIIDEITQHVGFRWFEFKDYGAFYLNGKRLLLRGTHRHEEHAGIGSAMSNEQHRADMELIKEMGANFVRLAHYPQDPEIYKACDELGILVWDELPWCRGGLGNSIWKKNTKNMLTEMIEQNYNHPSIIIWSLGNEIYWLPDFENGDDREEINKYLTELNDLAHELDPNRKTAIRKYYEGSDIVDVFSPSIWSGWYSGSYKNYQKAIDSYKKEYPHFLHTEYGGSSHYGRHTENPITGEGEIQSDGWEESIVQTDVSNIAQIGDWSENYIVDLFDWHLRITENDSTFVGNAQWAFKDFGTPLRPENGIPYINQKGLVDRARNPKDAFYVFKSYWNSTDPFTYIESHSWTERQGKEGLARNVRVYSNCEEVELFLNNKSLGTKRRDKKAFPAQGLNWSLNFKEGKNTLKSVGIFKDGTKTENTLEVNYRFTKNGKATRLSLDYKKLENGNYLITATALDKNDLRCLDYEERVYFQCLSGGKAKKNLGTPTGSLVIEMANGKASIEVKKLSKKEHLKMMVLNQSFKGSFITIKD